VNDGAPNHSRERPLSRYGPDQGLPRVNRVIVCVGRKCCRVYDSGFPNLTGPQVSAALAAGSADVAGPLQLPPLPSFHVPRPELVAQAVAALRGPSFR
jgi:hypothetical protein